MYTRDKPVLNIKASPIRTDTLGIIDIRHDLQDYIKKTKGDKTMGETEHIEEKIKLAGQTLDRTINFIRDCNLKASGMLLMCLVALASVAPRINYYHTSLVGTVFIYVDMVLLLFGMYNLLKCLMAKTEERTKLERFSGSRLFFTGVSSYVPYTVYFSNFSKMNTRDILNELLEQVYVNASIAKNKHILYNHGVVFTGCAMALLIVILFVG